MRVALVLAPIACLTGCTRVRSAMNGLRGKLRGLANVAVAFIILPGCSILFHEEKMTYPYDWPRIREGASSDVCPEIAGSYIDGGEYKAPSSGRPCDYQDGECHSLLFGLLYKFHDQPVKGGALGFFGSNRRLEVRIEQPADDVIKVTAAGQEHLLAKAAGDFTCDKNGIRLEKKGYSGLPALLDVVNFESRIFNVGQDGSLVMKSEWHNVGHYTVLPFSVRNEGWVRWERIGAKSSSE